MKNKHVYIFIVLMLLSSCVDTLFVIPLSATTEWPPTVSNQSPINESTGINIPSSYFGVTINSSANFTIVVLGDMQHYYYQDPPELPYQIFYNITRWIANNTRTNNIVFVGQVGDITDNLAGQMPIASYCMDFIEDPATTGLTDGIPYLAIIGNDHDVENKFNSYFGIANFSDKSYYGGHYGSDNYNSWVNFSASGMNFIVVGLPYNESGHYMNVAWADNLLQNYSDRRAIVISHDVLNSVDLERDGIEINATLNHNQNLFLMLCGHNKQQTQKTITSNGHTVYAIQSDYSAFYPGDPDKTGYIRLMQFCPTENKIHVKTYSPYLDAWQTGSDHQFDLDYDMSGATSPQMNITWQTNASGNWETFNTTTNVNNGTYYAYNTSWVNQYNTKYYWRVLVDDGNGGWRNETYYFTTGSQTINAPTVTTNSSTGVEETNATLWGYLQNNGSADTTCGFWYDTTSGGTTNNQSIGTVSNSTLFSYNASVLAPGQLYFFKAWTSNSAGFNGTSNELTFLTKPNATTGFTARANSSTMIYLSWTNGTGANNTYIERNAVSSWVRGAGTLVYNGTGINYENTSLSANTTYYYQAWSYTSWAGLTQWSDLNASANNRTNSLLVISDPAPNGSSIHFPISTSSLTIQINDSEGDAFNWTIETSPNIGNASGFGAQNGTKTCTISGLSYSTTYYWFVNATDVGSGNWTNQSYYFTTESQPQSNNPPPPYQGSVLPSNNPPTANIGGPYHGFVNQTIMCNGSKSTDDGTIVNYSWSFGDGVNGSGRCTNHTYTHSGNFTVNLTVKDNIGASNTTTSYAFIVEENQNQLPEPIVNDTISDDKNISYISDVGYLIDNDSDGVYDMFYCNETRNQTSAQKQENGTYLIDTNGDGVWDHCFDPAAGLTSYQNTDASKKTPSFELMLTVFALLFVVLWKRKRLR